MQWAGPAGKLLVVRETAGAGAATDRHFVMPLPKGLRTAKPLGYFVDHLDGLPASGWLYIRANADEIKLETHCYPVEIDSRDVSEEEMVAFEAAWTAAGFKSFLCDGQIREIVGNLEEQRFDHTRAELERAIDFYWRHDAFIVLDGDVA